jgi:hypothetical protein
MQTPYFWSTMYYFNSRKKFGDLTVRYDFRFKPATNEVDTLTADI